MTWTDIPAVHQIEQQVFDTTGWSVETFWSELAGVPVRRWHLVVTDSGKIVAFGGVAFLAPDCDIQTVVVAPGHRRRGFARGIVERLLDHGRAQGATRCHLEVAADNAAAMDLYSEFGFVVIDRRDNYYSAGSDALIMQCKLGSDATVECSSAVPPP